MNNYFCSAAILLSVAPPAFAEEITSDGLYATGDHDVEEVITTASPIHSDKDNVIQGISILSGDTLKEKSAATIGETLQGELGISSSSFGPSVGIPVIRGQSANRVKVMQNSLDTLDASATSPDHAVGTEALLAERIEVLRGPSTLRYGNGAIGGVVNVIDNRIPGEVPGNLSGGLELRHGGVNDGDNAVFKLDGGSGQFAWHLDGLYRGTDNIDINGSARHKHDGDHDDEDSPEGFIDNTDSRTKNATAGFSWVGSEGFIGLSVSRLENNYGIPEGAHEHHEEGEGEGEEPEGEHDEAPVRIDLEQTRYDLKAELDNPIKGFEKLNFRLGYNDYQHVELEGTESSTRFTNDAWEGRLEMTHSPWDLGAWGEWHGAVGLQMQQRDFAAIGEEDFVPESDISSYGFFWLEDLKLDEWHIEVGVRGERQEIDPTTDSAKSHNTLSTSGAVQWSFAKDQHLSLSLTHAERAPSVEELFSDGPHLATGSFVMGDRNLQEEASLNYEVGYQYHGDVTFMMFVFYNDISDFIYQRNTGLVNEASELTIFRYDQQDATFKGFESKLSIPLNEQLTLSLFGDHVRAEFKGGSDVPRVPPTRFGSELEYDLDNWRATLRWTEVQDQNHPGDQEETTEGYSRLDTNLSYHISGDHTDYTLFLRGSNLLNEEIRNAASFLKEVAPEPGRNIEMGVRVTF